MTFTNRKGRGHITPQQLLLNDAARIIRALVEDDAADWGQAIDWLKTYERTKGGTK